MYDVGILHTTKAKEGPIVCIMCKHLPTTGDIFKKNVAGYRQMLEKCQWFKANA